MIGTVKCFNIIQSDIQQFPLKFLDGRTTDTTIQNVLSYFDVYIYV